mmetsp:Transcript_23128/g.57032  ORF Transcript_23128/g.57032 Transcript_23128/m.57032 type:complete len:227 (-) Transcript_23128:523-1203(-)
MPHSVRFWPLKRPARSGASGAVRTVVTVSPIDWKPSSCSVLYGILCSWMKDHTSSLLQLASGLTLTLPSTGSTSIRGSDALSPPCDFRRPVTHSSTSSSSSPLRMGCTFVTKSKRCGSARHRNCPYRSSNSSLVDASSGRITRRFMSPKCFCTLFMSSYVSGNRCSVSIVPTQNSRLFASREIMCSVASPVGPKLVNWHHRFSGTFSMTQLRTALGCSLVGSWLNC